MLNKLLIILLCSLVSFSLRAQTPAPSGLPAPYSTGYYRIGWIQSDSGFISALRDTTIRSKYAGLHFLWQHSTKDTSDWFWNGGRYIKTLNTQDTLPGRFLVTPSFLNSQGYLKNITGLIQQGTNVTITGSGTILSPYVLNSSGGGGGGNTNSNIGAGYRIAIPNTNNIKTIFCVGCTWDSTTNTNALTLNVTPGITQLTGDGSAGPGSGSQAFTLATVNSNVGSFGDASHVATFTTNAKGLNTAAGQTSIQISESQVTNLVSDLAGKQATGNYITGTTGDVVATGPGSVSATIQASAVTTTKINNNAVTYAKIQAASGAALLGTSSAGNYGEITLGTGLAFSGSVLNATGGSFTNPMSINGDMIYQVGGTYGRLAVAAHAGMKLTSGTSGTLAWVDTTAGGGGSQNLQQVTTIGNTTNTQVKINRDTLFSFASSIQRLQVGDSALSAADSNVRFGDSWTVGTGSTPTTQGYAYKLDSLYGINLANRGVNGYTLVSQGLGTSMMEHLANIPVYNATIYKSISFLFGVNDSHFALSSSTYISEYERLIDTTTIARGWPIGLVKIFSPGYNNGTFAPTITTFVTASHTAATARGADWVDLYTPMLLAGESPLMNADSIHPNNVGAKFVAQVIARGVTGIPYGGNTIINGTLDVYKNTHLHSSETHDSTELHFGTILNQGLDVSSTSGIAIPNLILRQGRVSNGNYTTLFRIYNKINSGEWFPDSIDFKVYNNGGHPELAIGRNTGNDYIRFLGSSGGANFDGPNQSGFSYTFNATSGAYFVGPVQTAGSLKIGGDNTTDVQRWLIRKNTTAVSGLGSDASSNMRIFIAGSTYLSFGSVNSSDGTTYSEAARIGGGNQNMIIGTTTDNSVDKLQIAGSLSVTSTARLKAGQTWGVTTSAASLTLLTTFKVWTFTGSSIQTWTLPALSTNTGLVYTLVNRGSAVLTIQAAGSDNLYTTSAVTSITISPGASYELFNDGSFWLAQGYASTSVGATNIGSTQNATSYSLTSSTGTGTTLNTATTSLAGLLDTARAKFVDSLRSGSKTFTLFALNGLTGSTDSIQWGGTLYQATTIHAANNNISFGTTTTGDSANVFKVYAQQSVIGSVIDQLNGNILYQTSGTTGSSDANTSVGTGRNMTLSAAITANRTLTLGNPSTFGTGSGRDLVIEIQTSTSNAFQWIASPAIYNGSGADSVTSLCNGATYQIYSDGARWVMKATSYGSSGSLESSAGSLTLSSFIQYIFTGSTTTWTLPPLNGNQGRSYHIKNTGSGNITLGVSGSDHIYDTSQVTSVTIAPGAVRTLYASTSNWNLE